MALTSVLASLNCPVAEVGEVDSEGDLRSLLVQASPTREKILDWILTEIATVSAADPNASDAVAKTASTKYEGQSVGHRLEGIAIPHSKHFADATLDERKQIQTWLLLFRLVSASRKHRTVEADRATKLDQMTKDPFLHPTHKVGTFIPRDVEKDVREVSKKLTIPNSDKVERICSLMTAKMAGMNRDESITDLHGRDGNVAKFLNTFQDKFQEFNLRYNDSYGTLLEAVQNKHRMGDDAQASAVKGAEKTAETMVKMTALMRSIHSIHKDVTAIENSMKELGFLKQLVKFRESNMTHFNSPTETLQT